MFQLLEERKINLAAFVAAFVCSIAMVLMLHVPNQVGIANNGDFIRVISPNGIEFVDNNSNIYKKYEPTYKMVISGDSFAKKFFSILKTDYSTYDYVSSQTFIIRLSKILNVLSNKIIGNAISHYSLFWMGIIYISFFTLSIYLILKFLYKRFGLIIFIFSSLVFLFVFCDQGYILYFHSFFGEPLQYVSTFLAIGILLHLLDSPKRGFLVYTLYYLVVGIMATSKYAYTPLGILFALLPLVLIKKIQFPRRYIVVITALSCVVFLFYSAYFTPKWIDNDTNFNAVFSGVLKFGDTNESDLIELNLDPSLVVLKGWQTYLNNYPIDITTEEFDNQFFSKISKGKIAVYYFKHPVRFIQAMQYSAGYTKFIRPYYLTNFQEPSVPNEQSYRFSLWEKLRSHAGINNLWVILATFLIAFGACIYEIFFNDRINKVVIAALAGTILFSALFNFVTPYMGNGVCDIAKHLFGFVYLYDLILFVLVGYAIKKIQIIIHDKKIREKQSVEIDEMEKVVVSVT